MWCRYDVAVALIVTLAAGVVPTSTAADTITGGSAVVLDAFGANAVGQNFADIVIGGEPGLIGLAAQLSTLFVRHRSSRSSAFITRPVG